MGTTGLCGDAPVRGHSDGDPVPLDAEPLRAGDARPGDLVFVRADRTRLGAVISELDGCGFSHVGVLDEAAEPTLLSARTDRHGLGAADFGGVRRDPLAALQGRGLFVAPLAVGDEVRSAGLARLHAWVEAAGPDRDSHSRFSYVKLVVVSAALAAIRRRRPLGIEAAGDLWEATIEAADALRWGGDDPGFYCAEAVAAAYGLTFTVDALWVRDGEPHPRGLAPHASPPPHPPPSTPAGVIDLTDGSAARARPIAAGRQLPTLAELWDAVGDLGLAARPGRAVVDLLWTLWRYDPALAGRLFDAAKDLAHPPAADDEEHDPEPLPGGPFTPPPFVVGNTTLLPTALVTPRLLLSRAVVTSVHPLAL